ncbi:MAG: hypothetical protein AAFQ36_07840 [Pseudomonadota bacterium]
MLETQTFLIAVGGVRLKWWASLPFFALAAPSLAQAKRAKGCVFAETFSDGHEVFSITGWSSGMAMKRYARSWPHRLAAKSSPYLTVRDRFHHFQTTTRPTPQEAIARWREAA